MITKKKYYDIFWDLANKYVVIPDDLERLSYIEDVIKEETNGDEKEMRELFEFGQKEGHIPKNLKYSYWNLIQSLSLATEIGLDLPF